MGFGIARRFWAFHLATGRVSIIGKWPVSGAGTAPIVKSIPVSGWKMLGYNTGVQCFLASTFLGQSCSALEASKLEPNVFSADHLNRRNSTENPMNSPIPFEFLTIFRSVLSIPAKIAKPTGVEESSRTANRRRGPAIEMGAVLVQQSHHMGVSIAMGVPKMEAFC